MLVLVPRKPILSVLVPPVDTFWQFVFLENLPAVGRVFDFAHNKLTRNSNVTPSHLAVAQEFAVVKHFRLLVALWVILWLRERIYCVVVARVSLFLFGSLVPHWIGPGVLWCSPSTITFDGNVVGASADAEETVFAPVRTPRISNHPVLLAALLPIPHN